MTRILRSFPRFPRTGRYGLPPSAISGVTTDNLPSPGGPKVLVSVKLLRGSSMTKYVIGPDVAISLAHAQAVIGAEHQILAPTLLRSQLLSMLYQAARRGEITKKDAERRFNYVRGLRIRLLGDRALQDIAWKVADQLGWSDTYDAEYVALTQLQADAFITLDRQLARAVNDLVTVAPIEALS